MRSTSIHLKHGAIIALAEQAEIIRAPLVDMEQLRLQVFEYLDDALAAFRARTPRVILADYERFGAAGVHGLAELMGACHAPLILFVHDVSDWEREQFAALGVQRVFDAEFRISELADEVRKAMKRRHKIGSSDRLPVVAG